VFHRDLYEDGLRNETSWELLIGVKDIQFNSVYCDGVNPIESTGLSSWNVRSFV
jgi:hypothetical protein